MLFVILPEVKYCCCCVSLRRGTISIGVFYVLLTGINLLGRKADSCYEGADNSMCQFHGVWLYLQFVQAFAILSVFIVSGMLIIGVIMENHKVVSVFMYVLTIMVVIDFLIDAYIFFIANPLPNCGIQPEMRVFCITFEFILKILFAYFLVVVKSYRSTILILRNPMQRWRSALSFTAVSRTDNRRDRRGDAKSNRSGSIGGASSSTSKPDQSEALTNDKRNVAEEESRGEADNVADNFAKNIPDTVAENVEPENKSGSSKQVRRPPN